MEDNERSITYGETYVAECAKDAQADALVFGHKHWTATGGEYVGRYDYAEAGEVFRVKAEPGTPEPRVPAFGADANAARQLVAAVPEERRRKFHRALVAGVAPETRVRYTYEFDDADLYALLTATPRQLRDAVLAAMEEPL